MTEPRIWQRLAEWSPEDEQAAQASLRELGPDPRALAEGQAERARQWLADVRAGVGVRWFSHTLHDLTGRLLPGWTCLLGGYSKTAKTTLLMHQALYLADHGTRVVYVGTETASEILRLQAVALRLGWPVEDVVTGARHWTYQGDAYEQPMTAEELETIHTTLADLPAALMFADTDAATVGDACYWMRWAEGEGAACCIVDHVHQLDTGSGDRFTDLERAVRQLGQEVKGLGLVGLIAAQFRESTHDPLANHDVPGDGQWYGTKAFNQVGAVNLQLWRPIKPAATEEDKRLVRQGAKPLAEVLRPNTIGVRCSAHRIRGGRAMGELRLLAIHGDRITDLETR